MKEITIDNKKLDEWTLLNIEHMLEMIDRQQPKFATKIVIDEDTGEVASVAKIYKLPLKKEDDKT